MAKKNQWGGIDKEYRLSLLNLALGGIPSEQQEELLRELRISAGVSLRGHVSIPDLVAETSAVKSLAMQINLAAAEGWNALLGLSEDEFRQSLRPLQAIAEDMPDAESSALLPCLLVFPWSCISGAGGEAVKRRRLISHVNVGGRSVHVEGSENWHTYIEHLDDRENVPNTPYLAVDVQLGRELVGLVAEYDENEEDHSDYTIRELNRRSLKPLTFDEGLMLFAWLQHFAVGFGMRLLGTARFDTNWPDLKILDGRLVVDDHSLEGWQGVEDHVVPYCRERITA